MNANSSCTPSQDFVDQAIKDAWYTFFLQSLRVKSRKIL